MNIDWRGTEPRSARHVQAARLANFVWNLQAFVGGPELMTNVPN